MKKLVIVILLFVSNFINGEGDKKQKHRVLFGEPSYTNFNINNISTPILGDGRLDALENRRGFIYPKGGYGWKSCVYQSGFVWGGKINGQIRTGGSVYRTGLKPGKILSDGTAENPELPNVRVYRIRPDYEEGNMQSEINDYEGSEEEIREQYRKDWYEWPASDGAPFEDVNLDGFYNPEIDIPGILGADQTIWYVANDLDSNQTKYLYGSLPFGFEMQVTVWGYDLPEPLGNMMFRKYIVINKGNNVVEDMYFGAWSDPDVGYASDDYVGCDTLLNMGFVYNSDNYDGYENVDLLFGYGSNPPAVGFQFLQGPITEGNPFETANFKGRKIPGKKNIPMTAFGYIHKCCSPIYGDPYNEDYIEGTLKLYNYLQGRNGFGNLFTIPDELGGGVTQFAYSGDPVTGEGYLLNYDAVPGDYRLMPSTGPFNMMPGDTQEVIIAQFAAGAFDGCSNMGSLGLLKRYAEYADFIYDHNFIIPYASNLDLSPNVNVTSLHREIILTWGDEAETLPLNNGYSSMEFSFQGYNVYQFPDQTSSIDEAIRLATIDKIDGIKNVVVKSVELESGYPTMKVEAYGNDTGLNRYFQIKKDYFSDLPLNDGTNYYFAVTAYYILYKDGVAIDLIERNPQILRIMPESEKPGVRYEGKFGQEIDVLHNSGNAAGKISVNVINPVVLTGHDYEITFSDDLPFFNKWNLIDVTVNSIVLEGIPYSSPQQQSLVVDGFSISVENIEKEFGRDYSSDYYGVAQVAYGDNIYWEPVWNFIINENFNSDIYYVSSSTGRVEDAVANIEYGIPNDFELRFTDEGGYAVYGFEDNRIARVPFELWDINRDSEWDNDDDVRMIPFLLSNDDSTKSFWGWGTGVSKLGNTDYPSSDRIFWAYPEDDSFGAGGYEKFADHCELSGGAGAIYDLNSDQSTDGYYANLFGDWKFPISDIIICDFDRDGNYPTPSTTIRFYSPRPFLEEDSYSFIIPGVVEDEELAKIDVDKINVFPNPYYGGHNNELNQYQNYVMFNHLPQRATFRIFNLAGHLVRTLHKDDDTQFYLWDLQNENRLLAPSGLYIIYIEMPDLGRVKVLKLAIVQIEVVPGNF